MADIIAERAAGLLFQRVEIRKKGTDGMVNEEWTAREAALRSVLTWQGLANPRYAVVIPVTTGGEEPELLIEVRAAGISQAGDPCFPGGRIEAGESPAEAALRELKEELGIAVGPERLLGQLPTVQTLLGRRTDVFVCFVTQEEADGASPALAEVSELLRVPLTFFLSRPNAMSYRVGEHTIWGMTAGAIRYFCDAWQRAVLPDNRIAEAFS